MLEARAFEPEFLHKLDGLVLGARRARTQRAGRRIIGRHQGGGIEPENFREYSPGDDLRFLDWNAFARLDDLTIRTFRAERQLEITIMVDGLVRIRLRHPPFSPAFPRYFRESHEIRACARDLRPSGVYASNYTAGLPFPHPTNPNIADSPKPNLYRFACVAFW